MNNNEKKEEYEQRTATFVDFIYTSKYFKHFRFNITLNALNI